MGTWARWRAWIDRVLGPAPAELVDGPLPGAVPPPVRPLLRPIAAEALIRQDEAERVLGRIRRREAFGEIMQQSGPLVRRFFDLQDALPGPVADAGDERIRNALSVILHHHALVLATAQDLLACEWRSDRIARQVDTFDGLGPPARLLEQLYAELSGDRPDQLPR